MSSTAARIKTLINENLKVDGQPLNLPEDLNTRLTTLGVSSLDVVAFGKVVAQEFNVTLTPEDCVKVDTVQKLIDFIDSRTG